MPVVHIGAPGLKVQLAELFARPLPTGPAASGVAAAALNNSASGDRTANGIHTHAADASGQEQQPAYRVQLAGISCAAAPALSCQEAVANGDAGGSARVPAATNAVRHAGADDAANALSLPSLPEAARRAEPGTQQPQHSTPAGVAAVMSVGLQHPATDDVPGKATVDATLGKPPAAPVQRAAPQVAIPEDPSCTAPQPGADAVPAAPGAAASPPQQPADATPEAGTSALSAAAVSCPQLRSVERMAVGKDKYSITVRAKVACRLFADARGEASCDAIVVAPDGTEYPVKLKYANVCPCYALHLGETTKEHCA